MLKRVLATAILSITGCLLWDGTHPQQLCRSCDFPTLGIDTEKDSNAVGVALSRRRYSQLDSIPLRNSYHSLAACNVYGYMLYVTFSRSTVPLRRCRLHLDSHRSPLGWHVTYVTCARVV